MYLRFAFEGPVHVELDCVPLTVRRKLDLAALKISLAGWQSLPRAERLALCHLPVETDEDVAIYREILTAFAQRAATELRPIAPHEADRARWCTRTVADPVRERLREPEHARTLAALDAAWGTLSEEARYALVKLADPKRGPEKLLLALGELGFFAAAAG